MKGFLITGILLVVIGVASLAYGGISYTTNETVLDVGPVEAEVEKERTIPMSPVLGVLALAAGGFMIYKSGRTS